MIKQKTGHSYYFITKFSQKYMKNSIRGNWDYLKNINPIYFPSKGNLDTKSCTSFDFWNRSTHFDYYNWVSRIKENWENYLIHIFIWIFIEFFKENMLEVNPKQLEKWNYDLTEVTIIFVPLLGKKSLKENENKF